MSDDTPTERFTPPEPAVEPSASPSLQGKASRSKALIIALSVLGALLLIAVVIIVTLLLARGTDAETPAPTSSVSPTPTMTASETPSPPPSESPSAAPSAPPAPSTPPVSTGPVFDSFSPADNSSVGCSGNTGEVPLTFTWTSTGATEAAIGVQTFDAFAGPWEFGLPASATYTELKYSCGQASQYYTVSIRGVSGQTNKTVTLTR